MNTPYFQPERHLYLRSLAEYQLPLTEAVFVLIVQTERSFTHNYTGFGMNILGFASRCLEEYPAYRHSQIFPYIAAQFGSKATGLIIELSENMLFSNWKMGNLETSKIVGNPSHELCSRSGVAISVSENGVETIGSRLLVPMSMPNYSRKMLLRSWRRLRSFARCNTERALVASALSISETRRGLWESNMPLADLRCSLTSSCL